MTAVVSPSAFVHPGALTVPSLAAELGQPFFGSAPRIFLLLGEYAGLGELIWQDADG